MPLLGPNCSKVTTGYQSSLVTSIHLVSSILTTYVINQHAVTSVPLCHMLCHTTVGPKLQQSYDRLPEFPGYQYTSCIFNSNYVCNQPACGYQLFPCATYYAMPLLGPNCSKVTTGYQSSLVASIYTHQLATSVPCAAVFKSAWYDITS